jgi:hypothetical protein
MKRELHSGPLGRGQVAQVDGVEAAAHDAEPQSLPLPQRDDRIWASGRALSR